MVDKIIFSKILVAFMLFSLGILHLPTVKADEAEMAAPQVLIKHSTEEMLQALKENEAELKEDSSVIFGLVESIIMPHFDFDKIAKLALGKNWRKVSAQQKVQFTEQFRLLLIRTYSTAMLEYTNEEIKFLPFRSDLKKKKVKVPMEIIQPGGPSIPMTLSMYLNKADVWKVYDVKIDGISLVTNYRSTFTTQIRNEGMDKVIESLAKKNEKVRI